MNKKPLALILTLALSLMSLLQNVAHAGNATYKNLGVTLEKDTVIQGSPCNINGIISETGVTGIIFSVQNEEEHIHSYSNDPNGEYWHDYTYSQAYYDGTTTPVKVETYYSSPRSIYLNVNTSRFNQEISFGRLDVGNYVLNVRLLKGSSSIYMNLPFQVVPNPNPVSINLSGFKSALPFNQGYAIPGSITSTCRIKKIVASVLIGNSGGSNGFTVAKYRTGYTRGGIDYSGVKASHTWNSPSSKKITITGSNIDNNIFFAGLSKGNYYFEIIVYPVYGDPVYARRSFTIK